MQKNYQYSERFEVRDYECDIQGIVNNAVYQNYLEHTRHKFLQTLELDFSGLHDQKIDPVVRKTELTYKVPLKSGDKFLCTLNMHKEDAYKIIFEQDIYRLPDEKLVLKGKITAVVLQNGKLVKSDWLF